MISVIEVEKDSGTAGIMPFLLFNYVQESPNVKKKTVDERKKPPKGKQWFYANDYGYCVPWPFIKKKKKPIAYEN